VRCVVALSPPIGGVQSSRQSEQRFHMFRAELTLPLGHGKSPVQAFP
jgi:hypothetical protein